MEKAKWILLSLALAPTLAFAKKEITRELLLKDSPVPEIREFPESSKYAPCQDFHKYVCDEAESNFKLPADRPAWSFSFSDNSERILHAKKNFFQLIEKGYPLKGQRIQQVKNYYLACMNEKANVQDEKAYVAEQKATLAKIKSVKDLQSLILQGMRGAHYSPIVYSSVSNLKDPSKNDLLMFPAMMTLPDKSYYADATAKEDLQKIVQVLFEEVGLENAEKRAKAIVELETGFAESFPASAEFRQLFSANTTVERKQFIQRYPNLNIDAFINKLPTSIEIRVFTPKAFEYLNEKIKPENLNVLKDYVLYQRLASIVDDSSPKFSNEWVGFKQKYMRGPAKRPDRLERCVRQVSGTFSFEIDEYLTPILFPGFSREKVIQMVTEVRGAILANLRENTWLSPEAKAEAIKKMEVAKLYLVQPTTDLEWNFQPLGSYSAKSPVKNILKLQTLMEQKKYSELIEGRVRERWDYPPLTLNAYYSPPDNHFVLLQGILQPPFYSEKSSSIENLAAIGSVIGHELGHGIDDSGSKFDDKGILRQWMTMKDLAEFSKRGSQFVKRFDAVGHNGRFTLGENIGDHVGITSSYRAVFSSRPTASVEDKKLFFKSYARMWCSVAPKAFEENQLKTDPHSLGRERINQQVVQLDGFYEAFSCKPGDKMYVKPKDRIKIW